MLPPTAGIPDGNRARSPARCYSLDLTTWARRIYSLTKPIPAVTGGGFWRCRTSQCKDLAASPEGVWCAEPG